MVVLAPFIPYAVAGAQAGLGFLNMDAQNTEKRRQRNARQTQLKISHHQENERRKNINRQGAMMDMVKARIRDQQLEFNREAAMTAFAAEQQRFDDVLTKSGFATNQQQIQLMQAMGANAAANEGNRGRSFERAGLISTLGQYGRVQAERLEQLASERGQYERNLEKIDTQLKGANLRARASTMIPSQRLDMLPPPNSLPFANPKTNLLNAGSLLIGAAQTGFSLTAPGDKFFGITRRG